MSSREPASHPRKTDALHGATFTEFARRAMMHAASVTDPEAVAWFLASYARDALARIGHHQLPALASVRKALEEALGLKFEGEKSEHSFRSTLVQTLLYGLFSAWVLWLKQHPGDASLPTGPRRLDLHSAPRHFDRSPRREKSLFPRVSSAGCPTAKR